MNFFSRKNSYLIKLYFESKIKTLENDINLYKHHSEQQVLFLL